VTVISVVMLAYGDEPWLHEAVGSALATQSADVIVIDNGCTSDAVRTLPVHERLTVITATENLGFAGGVNRGISASDGDVVCLLNSDAELQPGTLDAMVAALDDGADLVGPVILLADTPDLVNSAGNPLHVLGLVWAGHLGERRADLDPTEEATTLSGACLALRRSTWDELGGFDEAFFAYHEDADLCWRARQRGMSLELVHEVGVLHHYEFSRNSRKMYLMERNRLLFVLTTYEARTLAVLAVPLVGFELALLLVAWRQGWAREKVRGWAWLARNGSHLRARRREVSAVRRVGDDVLSGLWTAKFDAAQLPIPAAGRPLEVILQAWWRVGRRALGARNKRPKG
jgi:GT2 family glycosyltransferase